METERQMTNKNVRTFSGHFVKVRFKQISERLTLVCVFLMCVFGSVQCNRPPRFLINGQTEIVLRLKEGKETPVGKSFIIVF